VRIFLLLAPVSAQLIFDAAPLEGLKTASPELIEKLKSMATAESRLGSPLDVAFVVAFLSEVGSSWINGDTISVTGGAIMW